MKNFVTIFPYMNNVHLIKDVGQVGNALAHQGDYKAKVVCYKNGMYPNADGEVENVSMEFIKNKGKIFFLEKAILDYITKHAHEIDVLHLFHLSKMTIYYGLHYKKCRKDGKLYIKMDTDGKILDNEIIYSKKRVFDWFHKRKEKKFFKVLDLISAENPTLVEKLKTKYPILERKTILVTNGVNNKFIENEFISRKPFKQKENILLSVGRIGAPDKNYEMLFDLLPHLELKDWKIVLVGPVQPEYKNRMDLYLENNEEWKPKIQFSGPIYDRKKLYKYYDRSKIFFLMSKFESFGIALIEAMYFGNFIIGTTGMSSFDYITSNKKYGWNASVKSPKSYAELINKAITNQEKLEQLIPSMKKHVAQHFYWTDIVTQLNKKLNK